MTRMGKSSGPAGLAVLPAAARFSLRIAQGGLARAAEAFGAALPGRIGGRIVAGGRSAVCLGPDEWVLHTLAEDAGTVRAAFEAIYGEAPHSLTDISDREVAIAVSGLQAADLLSSFCPRDVEAIAVDSGCRTVFDTVQIVLTRESGTLYRIEVWRSYFPHVWALLNTANRELGSGL